MRNGLSVSMNERLNECVSRAERIWANDTSSGPFWHSTAATAAVVVVVILLPYINSTSYSRVRVLLFLCVCRFGVVLSFICLINAFICLFLNVIQQYLPARAHTPQTIDCGWTLFFSGFLDSFFCYFSNKNRELNVTQAIFIWRCWCGMDKWWNCNNGTDSIPHGTPDIGDNQNIKIKKFNHNNVQLEKLRRRNDCVNSYHFAQLISQLDYLVISLACVFFFWRKFNFSTWLMMFELKQTIILRTLFGIFIL